MPQSGYRADTQAVASQPAVRLGSRVADVLALFLVFARIVSVGVRVTAVLRRRSMAYFGQRPWSVRARGRYLWRAARLWARRTLADVGVRVRYEGFEGVDLRRQFVVVANHESVLDAIVLTGCIPNGRFIAKKELDAYPIIGKALRWGAQIVIDRGNSALAMQGIRDAIAEWPRSNLIFFAPGTRSLDGTLGEFKFGAFRIAQQLGLPILPIAISGTFEILPKGCILQFRRHGSVVVRACEPIETAGLRREAVPHLRSMAWERIAQARAESREDRRA